MRNNKEKCRFILETRNICKQFFGIPVLKNISFALKDGEIHAIVGENGAGKSTLVKIICGVYSQDSGDIFVNEVKTKIKNSFEAKKIGIVSVYQEINLVPHLSVAENIFLSKEKTNKLGLLDRKKMFQQAKALLEELQFDLNPSMMAKDLSVAHRYLVQIARAIFCNAKIIIMDEPTAALSTKDVENLFRICEKFKDEGKSIIYITHRLDEIKIIADRVTAMRDGKIVAVLERSEFDTEKIIQHMIGRKILLEKYPKRTSPIGERDLLSVENLNSQKFIKDVSFKLKEGEVLGLAGLTGSGRSLLLNSLYGSIPSAIDKIKLDGIDISHIYLSKKINEKFSLVTEDRRAKSLVLMHSVKSNIELGNLAGISNKGFIKDKLANQLIDDAIENFNIQPQDRNYIVNFLSGGNQQKVAIAKALISQPRVLLLDEPTKGIDIGSKWEIYRLILEVIVKKGIGIILASSEFPELACLCDRIIVLYQGCKMAELSRNEFSQEIMLKAASGYI